MLRAAAIALFLTATVAPAPAQPAGDDDDRHERARQLILRARELGHDGKLPEAIALFKEADQLAPSAANQCNIGLAYAWLEQWAQAHLFLVRCRDRWEPGRPMEPWFADRLRSTEDALRAGSFAQVTLALTPPDAAASISAFAGDETVSTGTVWLPYGEHRLVVRRDGYRAAESTVKVVDDKTIVVSIELEAAVVAPPAGDPATDEPTATAPLVLDRSTPRSADDGPVEQRRTLAPMLVIGGAVAVGGGGAIAHVAALRAKDRAEMLTIEDGFDAEDEVYRRRRAVAIGLYSAAAVTAAAGIYWYARRSRTRHVVVVSQTDRGWGATVSAVWWR